MWGFFIWARLLLKPRAEAVPEGLKKKRKANDEEENTKVTGTRQEEKKVDWKLGR